MERNALRVSQFQISKNTMQTFIVSICCKKEASAVDISCAKIHRILYCSLVNSGVKIGLKQTCFSLSSCFCYLSNLWWFIFEQDSGLARFSYISISRVATQLRCGAIFYSVLIAIFCLV